MSTDDREKAENLNEQRAIAAFQVDRIADEFDAAADKVLRAVNALVVAVNGAVNGRLFCALLFVFNIATFTSLREVSFGLLALLSILPVGGAVLVDRMPAGRVRTVSDLALHAVTACLWVATFIKLATLG